MNYQIKALQLSVALHAAAIAFFIIISNSLVSENKLLVVDLTLLDTAGTSGSHQGTLIGAKNNESRGRKAGIGKKKISEVESPTPETLQAEKQDIHKLASPDTQATVLAYSDKNMQIETGAQGFGSMSSSQGNAKTVGPGGGTGSGIGSGIRGTSAGSSDSADFNYIRANFSYIKDMIDRKITYPQVARKMGWEGKVKISFVILSNGYAKDIKILEGSGKEILDKNAVEAVRTSSPFPRPPVAAQIIIPVLYKLH